MGINQLDVSLKRILETELKDWNAWFNYPSRINLVLTKLALQIEKVDFFKSDYGITIFFNFLEEFVKLKPSAPQILIAFNSVLQQIQERINARPRINNNQMDIIIAYFKLLKTMRTQDLFTRKEITFSAKNLTNLVLVATQSAPFPRHRFDIYAFLRLSFDMPRFLNAYSELTQSILLLARTEKLFSSHSIFKASDSFHTLGYLGRLLHYYHVNSNFNYELPAALEEIKYNGMVLYDFYKLHTKKDLLDFIFFKKFVSELTVDIADINLLQVCASDYPNHCNPDYQHFNSKFTCPEGSLPHFDIQIAHNHLTQEELISTCNPMRNAENEFFTWLKTIAWKPQNMQSSFLFSISPSQSDFNYTTSLLEGYEPSDFVGGVYFSKGKLSKGEQKGYFRGTAYSAQTASPISVHEYLHQLFTMSIKSSRTWSYKWLTEGIPEVFAGGVCHPWHLSSLKEYVNDTEILKNLRERKFSGYFNAYKWSAFLINEKPKLIKLLLTLYQEDRKADFYKLLDQFLNDPIQIKGFLDWMQLQAEVCSDYIKQYPDSEKSSIYLADVSKQAGITSESRLTKKTNVAEKVSLDKISPNEMSDPDLLARQIVFVLASSGDRDKAEKIELLFRKGANAKWQDARSGNTLLHYFIYYAVYSDEIAHLLLQYGADVSICNHNAVTAYQIGLRKQLELEVRQRDLVGRPSALADNLHNIQAIKNIIRVFQQSPSFPKNLSSSIAVMPTPTVPVLSSRMSNNLSIFTEKLILQSSTTDKEKPSLLSSQMSNSLFLFTKKPTLPNSTESIIYEKPPYEFHIMINVSLSVVKGISSAVSRYGFEKFMQNHEPFLRRHPYLFLLARNIIEAIALSTMNLICFPSTKGIRVNFNELESAGLYFAMDIATSFGFGLVNAKIQPWFNVGEKDGWIKYLAKSLGSTGLWTLFFLFSNASTFLGEKFQDHKIEVLLSGILNALLVAIIHQFAYQGFNYTDNCLHASKKTTEPEQAPLQAPVLRQALFSKLNKTKPRKSKKTYSVRVAEITENTQELLPRKVALTF